jgi:hypothetical protein
MSFNVGGAWLKISQMQLESFGNHLRIFVKGSGLNVENQHFKWQDPGANIPPGTR